MPINTITYRGISKVGKMCALFKFKLKTNAMQKQILLFGLFLSALTSNAQVNYQHYLDSTVRWTYEFSAGGAGASYFEFTEYTVQGDTQINAIWYWNVWAKTRSTFNGVPSESYRPVFGMRETPEKKFYQRFYNAQEESLMYDFNMEIGDTLQNDNFGFCLVDFIDTINFGNEKRLFFRSIMPCGIVEGIGFIRKGFYSWMHCFQKQQNLYPEGGSSCGFSATDDLDKTTQLRYWPNPARSEINLEIPPGMQQEKLQFRWISQNGQVLKEGAFSGMESVVSFPIQNQSPGMYVLMIGNGQSWIPLRVMVAG